MYALNIRVSFTSGFNIVNVYIFNVIFTSGFNIVSVYIFNVIFKVVSIL